MTAGLKESIGIKSAKYIDVHCIINKEGQNVVFATHHFRTQTTVWLCVGRYRRNWLLSACAYNNRRQETMRLIRSMRLTASVRLIERAYASKAGPLTSCVSRCWTFVTVRAACESPCKHLSFSTRTC